MSTSSDLSGITRPNLFVKRHRGLGKSIASLRWELFNAENNGLAESGAILRIGRCLYIVEQAYLDWMLSHGTAARRPGRNGRGRQ